MRSVHIVVGRTGTYEDYREWPVAAFTTKARAETFARRANDWLHAHCLHEYDPSRFRKALPTNPYDEDFECGYTGASYQRVQVFLDPPLPTKEQGA